MGPDMSFRGLAAAGDTSLATPGEDGRVGRRNHPQTTAERREPIPEIKMVGLSPSRPVPADREKQEWPEADTMRATNDASTL